MFTSGYSTYHSADDDPSQYFTTVSASSAVQWAYAEPTEAFIPGHAHDFVYYVSYDGATLYAECLEDGCYLTDEEMTLTLYAPKEPFYTGSPVEITTSEVLLESVFPNVRSSIDYYTCGDYVLLDLALVDCGEYWAEYTGKAEQTQYGQLYAGVVFRITMMPEYEEPALVLPDGLIAIEESAFEDDFGISTVWVPDSCEVIGENAFAGCAELRQIRLPMYCYIDDNAFDGCDYVFVFAPAGGTAEAWCATRYDCVFVEEEPEAD